MAKTLNKTIGLMDNFSFLHITSPNKNIPGVSRTVFTHVSHLHSLISDWIRVQDRGIKLCKTILALKLNECQDAYFPQQLKPLTQSLVEALNSLEHAVEGITTINGQLQALAKLQPTEQPVISTWSVRRISDNVSKIHTSILQEYQLKKVITENIAHCRDENLIEVYVSAWEFDAYLNLDDCAYLFVEVGLPTVA